MQEIGMIFSFVKKCRSLSASFGTDSRNLKNYRHSIKRNSAVTQYKIQGNGEINEIDL